MRRVGSPPVPMASMLVPRCTSRDRTVRSMVRRTTPQKAAPTKNSQMKKYRTVRVPCCLISRGESTWMSATGVLSRPSRLVKIETIPSWEVSM